MTVDVLSAWPPSAPHGLSDATMTGYAVDARLACRDGSGGMAVVEKLTHDLNDRGAPIPAEVEYEKRCSFHREALLQTHATKA